MGIFDFLKKKKPVNSYSSEKVSNDFFELNEFSKDLIQCVALKMFEMKIIKAPALNFLKEDHGIFEGLFMSRMTDEQFISIKNQDFKTYLWLLGAHSVGTAAYTVMCTIKYNKGVIDFGIEELTHIANTLGEVDAYEAGLNALGFDLNGNNKKCIDHIITTAVSFTMNTVGKKLSDEKYLKVFMNVMYNVGVTLIYGR